MELILNAAKERLAGQYVFLTPQEMGYYLFNKIYNNFKLNKKFLSFKYSFIQLDNTLKCFKMPDPTRSIDLVD